MDAKRPSWTKTVPPAVFRGLTRGLKRVGSFGGHLAQGTTSNLLPWGRDHGVLIAAVLFILLVIGAMYWGAPRRETNQPPSANSVDGEFSAPGDRSPTEEDQPLLPETESHAAAFPAHDWGVAPAGGPALTFPVSNLPTFATEAPRLIPEANDGPQFLVETYVPSEPPALSTNCVWLTGTIED